MHDVECAEIDGFIAAYKSLDGLMPEWIDHHSRDFQVRWAIVDANQIEHGELCITCDAKHATMSFTAIYKQKMICRLDIVPPNEAHANPFGGAALGLPNYVHGPHVHGWPENREYATLNGFGTLPYRRQVDAAVADLKTGLAWLAEELNLDITPEQRDILPPPQKGLF